MTEVMQVREAYRVEQWRQLMQQRNDFLSVDSGQPLSGWFSLQANFTKKGLRFL